MRPTDRVRLAATLLAVLAPAVGYGLARLWGASLLLIGLGGLWLAGQWKGWLWSGTAGLAGVVLAGTAGLWLGVGAGWGLAGVVGALAAWDLHWFAHRRGRTAVSLEEERLEWLHLRRLAAVIGLGAALGGGALLVRVNLGFGGALLLGGLALAGLALLLKSSRQPPTSNL